MSPEFDRSVELITDQKYWSGLYTGLSKFSERVLHIGGDLTVTTSAFLHNHYAPDIRLPVFVVVTSPIYAFNNHHPEHVFLNVYSAPSKILIASASSSATWQGETPCVETVSYHPDSLWGVSIPTLRRFANLMGGYLELPDD